MLDVNLNHTYQSVLYVGEPRNVQKDEKMEAAVSPLDQQINTKHEEKSGWWICGKDSDLKEDKHEIYAYDVSPRRQKPKYNQKVVGFAAEPVHDEIM